MTLANVLSSAERAYLLDRSARGLRSRSDPNARSTITNLINNQLGALTIVPETADSDALRYVQPLVVTSYDSAVTALNTNRDGIINEARTNNEAQFRDHYYLIEPTAIGDVNHDNIVNVHTPVYVLGEQLRSVGESDTLGDRVAFILQTAPTIRENVITMLRSEGATTDAAINELADLVHASYLTSHPERAFLRAQGAYSEGIARLNNLLPEDQRASYVARNITHKAQNGREREAVRDIYRAVSGNF